MHRFSAFWHMRLPHRLQGQKVKSQCHGAGAYCGGHLAAQLVIDVCMLSYVRLTCINKKTTTTTTTTTISMQKIGGGMAEWLASPDWDREVVGSNPGVARSDGQWWNL